MAKTSDFVSFRPGELADELLKRTDEAQMSTTAKHMLGRTFSMLKAERGQLQRLFKPAEMQLIFVALYNQRRDPKGPIERIADAVANDKMAKSIVQRYSVDAAVFLAKVRGLGPGALFAIDDGVAQFERLGFDEALGLNSLPSLIVLRRLGFIKTQGPAAWGFCTVMLVDLWRHELVLRRQPIMRGSRRPSDSVEELARKLVNFIRMQKEGDIDPDHDDIGFGLAYRIAFLTGFRHFRVEEGADGESAKIIEIPRDALVADLQNGSLADLVLQGVNAPDEAIEFTESPTPKPPANKRV